MKEAGTEEIISAWAQAYGNLADLLMGMEVNWPNIPLKYSAVGARSSFGKKSGK